MRRSLLLVVVWLTSSPMTAHAQIAEATFDADVAGIIIRPSGCPDEAYLCGDATVVDYGPAAFRWYLNSFEPVSERCGEYTASVVFRLPDGGELTLAEHGTDCGPGRSFSAYPPFSYGQPQEANGAWTIETATGAFEGTEGAGSNRIRVRGADFRASYDE